MPARSRLGEAARILVVDDSRVQRMILSTQLTRSGYRVEQADCGEEALRICQANPVDIVISDWVMPGMSGLDLCRALRTMQSDTYTYFILLTSKNESAEVAHGLDLGADDFLTKPVNGEELRARIAAGGRILGMDRDMKEKNRLLSTTLAELQGLYDSINRDLIEARRLQQSLVREHHRSFGRSEVSLMLRPSGHVGGDLVGFFPINARRVGLYAIDVSGHGITSALMTARLAGHLSGSSPEQNLALVLTEFGIYDGRPPAEVAEQFNRIVLNEMETDSYFTLVYADVDLITGAVSLVQAGHPHPVLMRADGGVELLGDGGLPVGLIEGASYQAVEARLAPGDRLFLVSDGAVEATDGQGAQLGEDGLARLITDCAGEGRRGPALLDRLVERLAAHSGGDFDDDVSCVLFEYGGAKTNAD